VAKEVTVKEKRVIEPFGAWLRRQTDRNDAVGRIARKVIAEETDLGRPLRALEDRPNFAMFIRAVSGKVGVTEADAYACWKEWAASLQQQEVR
jgi:hypothetical protein